jgi:hypothetical protein
MHSSPAERKLDVRLPAPRRIRPLTARVVLGGLLGLLAWSLLIPTVAPKMIERNQGDVALYETVTRRVKNGEPYYHAMASELRGRGYPTASPFNWRAPLPIVAVAAAPWLMTALFYSLGLVAIAGCLSMLGKEFPEAMLLATLAQIGVTVSLLKVPQLMLMSEAWAGFLIMASVVAYSRSWWVTGAAFGVAALIFRELAAPFCLVCGLMALHGRRRQESAVWVVGAIVCTGLVLLHASRVSAQLGAQELAHKESWIQFGGLPFLLRVISFTGWYDVLPAWARAIGCVLLAASVWATGAPRQLRAMVVTYFAFFFAVGLPFNQYWGLVVGPAFAAATGYGMVGLWRLISAASRRSAYAGP